MPIEKVIPYENNPRHNEAAVGFVANSLKRFGWQQPIVVDKDMVVIAGHTRLLAAKQLEMDKVPVVMADTLTAEQVKAYRLADNKTAEASQWDFEKLNAELDELTDLDMSEFGFIEQDIDWNSVPDLSAGTYIEPEHDMLECPACHHVDRALHFKKVSSAGNKAMNGEIGLDDKVDE